MVRTNVCMIDYPKDPEEEITTTRIEDAGVLKEQIKKLGDEKDSSIKFRLWVVEDLSREVIEALGSHYDVDPSFFREHIVDYIWYNISK